MSVKWSSEFLFTHIVEVGHVKSFAEMRSEGIGVYERRLRSPRGKPLARHTNTIVIVNKGGFQAMNSWVSEHGRASVGKATKDHVPVRSGIIVVERQGRYTLPLKEAGGYIHVAIRLNGKEKEVYGFEGYSHGA